MSETIIKKKKNYTFKFSEKFREELSIASSMEGISVTALIERECNRYLRVLKRALIDHNRNKEIEKRLIESKNND